jgi:hypothetical protein
VGIGGDKELISMASSTSTTSSVANNAMDGGKQVKPDLVDFVPHPPARLHAYADLEESTEMTFGSFHFLVRKKGSHRLAAPIFSGPSAVDSDFSRSSASSIDQATRKFRRHASPSPPTARHSPICSVA